MNNTFIEKHFGFSLAEALITLLIVCLITLASIPVLTKKRRTITDGGSGQWICTLVEQKDANGNVTGYKHVYWNSQTSDGDINDPSTWDVAGDGTSCTFAPPLKAKNFAVTLIGGGGGGANGKFSTEQYLNESKTATEELPKGKGYSIALFGGGGGGYNCINTQGGGAGAAGSYFYGSFELQEPMRFFSEVGEGGAIGSERQINNNAPSGGSSILRDKYGNTLVTAPGGGGGYSSSTMGFGINRNNFVGPLAEYPVMSQQFLTLYKGKMLRQGVKNETDNPAEIFSIDTYTGNLRYRDKLPVKGFYNNKITQSGGLGPFGNGGIGCIRRTVQNPNATTGSKGAVFLWRQFVNLGEGGNASPLQTITLSSINGKLVANVGRGGEHDEDGNITTAVIYDSKGKVTRSLKSSFGTKGIIADADDAVEQQLKVLAALFGQDVTITAKAGQNSFWLDKGGGAPGTYRGYHEVTVPKKCDLTVTETVGHYYLPGCVRVVPSHQIKPFENPNMVNSTRCSQQVSMVGSGPKEPYPCIGYKLEDITLPPGFSDSDGVKLEGIVHNPQKNIVNNSKLTNLLRGNYKDQDAFNAALSQFNLGRTGWNHSDSEAYSPYNSDCYLWANSYEKNSLKDIKYTHTIKNGADCPETKFESPKCARGGDGTYYGAGGGGGSVGIVNFANSGLHVAAGCQGGKGAPGAVIIEW